MFRWGIGHPPWEAKRAPQAVPIVSGTNDATPMSYSRGRSRITAMKDEYLVAALLIGAAAIGLGANRVQSPSEYCPNPSPASVTALFAPCQAFDTAIGHPVSKQEAIRLGLLTPDEQPTPAATQLAARY
jgi:hypothetical protein